MTLTLLAIAFLILLALAYRFYGRWVARQFKLDDSRATPARRVNDGVDFVPTKRFYLFGQHFSAIAAAGPIAGPILACQSFGWLPCLFWIGFGVVLIGAVHDFAALAASVRHGATSIAEIVREHLGTGAGRAMMGFIWIALIYVIVAFTDITAGTFVGGSEELKATPVNFNPGRGCGRGKHYVPAAFDLILGLVQRYLNPPLWLVTLIFVPAAFALSWVGTMTSNLFVLDHKTWGVLIIIYCGVASIIPVWALLQPRGYLGGFILYSALALGIVGVFFGGYEIQQPAFKSFDIGGMTGHPLPVSLCHHRLRRLFRLSWSGLFRNDFETSRPRISHSFGRLRRDARRRFCRADCTRYGDDRHAGCFARKSSGHDLRQRDRPIPNADYRQGQARLRSYLWSNGFLDLCL